MSPEDRMVGESDWLSKLTQIKAITGADCSPISTRQPLRVKGFKNKKHLQRPCLLERHTPDHLDFAREYQMTKGSKKVLFSDE